MQGKLPNSPTVDPFFGIQIKGEAFRLKQNDNDNDNEWRRMNERTNGKKVKNDDIL